MAIGQGCTEDDLKSQTQAVLVPSVLSLPDVQGRCPGGISSGADARPSSFSSTSESVFSEPEKGG